MTTEISPQNADGGRYYFKTIFPCTGYFLLHMGLLEPVLALTKYLESAGSLKQIEGRGELKIKDHELFGNYVGQSSHSSLNWEISCKTNQVDICRK